MRLFFAGLLTIALGLSVLVNIGLVVHRSSWTRDYLTWLRAERTQLEVDLELAGDARTELKALNLAIDRNHIWLEQTDAILRARTAEKMLRRQVARLEEEVVDAGGQLEYRPLHPDEIHIGRRLQWINERLAR